MRSLAPVDRNDFQWCLVCCIVCLKVLQSLKFEARRFLQQHSYRSVFERPRSSDWLAALYERLHACATKANTMD